jgi:hypothetical protein
MTMMRKRGMGAIGLSQSAWLRLDVLSSAFLVAAYSRDLLSAKGKNVNFGLSNNTWDRVDNAAIGLAIVFALRSIVDVMEEYEILFGKDTFFTGKGLVATVATRYNEF